MSYPPNLKPNVREKAYLKDDLKTQEWMAFVIQGRLLGQHQGA